MILEALIKIIVVVGIMLLMIAYMILAERKIAGWIQDRIGPNRAFWRGILQPICDAVKMLFKEDYNPGGVNKVLFTLAPAIALGLGIAAIAVVPFAGQVQIGGRLIDLQIASVDIGILYILALSGLGTYGVLLGGWASNNKYSFLGGLRVVAQMLSYETPLALMVLNIVLLSGTLRLEEIVRFQTEQGWFLIGQPLVYLIFLACIFAETKRLPFDLTECEQELVGGYHTEYSSMKFGLFFLAEYAHIIVVSCLAVVLFLGGWHLPLITSEAATPGAALVRGVVFFLKVCLFIYFFMWVRWTIPRFRIDQVMRLAWKAGVPMGLILLVLNGWILYAFPDEPAIGRLWQLAANLAVAAAGAIWLGLARVRTGGQNRPLPLETIDQITE